MLGFTKKYVNTLQELKLQGIAIQMVLTSLDLHRLNVWLVLTRLFGSKKREEESTEVLIQTLCLYK